MPRNLTFAAGAALLLLSACTINRSSLAFDDSAERIETSMAHELFSPSTPGAQGIFLASDAAPLAPEAEPSPTPTERRQSDWTTVGAGWRWVGAPAVVPGARPGSAWPSSHRR